jgi:transposase
MATAHVRSLTVSEGQHLQRVMRRGKDRTAILRAQVVLMSDQGFRAKQIADVTHLHEEYVRELIRLFNVDGLEILRRKPGSGRRPMFSEEEQTIIAEFALSPPQVLGQPFTRWTLEKLRRFLVTRRVVRSIGLQTLARILEAKKVRLQRTKTWKISNDPDFDAKKNG